MTLHEYTPSKKRGNTREVKLITATKLHKTYGRGANRYEALRGVSLTVAAGESLAILGKSGSGKSTLMHLLAGLDRPTSGSIEYQGKDVAKFNEAAMAKFRNANVGFIFQQFFLQPTLTVLENVLLPLKISGTGRAERQQRARTALEKVGLTDKTDNRATDLSGGQKQRVAIARAIVTEPVIIFADEPTGNLDTETAHDVINLLFELNQKEKITLVVVTHDEDLAKRCRRQLHIKDGVLV